MDEREIAQARDDLKNSISKVLGDFEEKYFHGAGDTGYQADCIMQLVLYESVSDIEQKIGRKSPYTKYQIEHICCKIGEWYLHWNKSFAISETPNWLGFSKEELKNMICGK
jgi:hypothetical protein